MNKTNELIDKLIFLKDTIKDRTDRDIINEACRTITKLKQTAQNGQSAIDTNKRLTDKIARGELVKVVRCRDCKHAYKRDGRKPIGCYLHGKNGITLHENDDYCDCGERSDENENN